ncbi:methyltransferase family protein [Nocardioides albertanoniae]|uniref:Methyltransferase family protein n=1 Tax=Nocardioides albertanoniae TaxID=1175486 RepID=A0A543AA43_9ACTN|nr:class I SAM-dependent methyltransferase [Nocardioides albertanoniae]TQL69445.1 methyltransferase family protein [Nocardioides albertanoniae]
MPLTPADRPLPPLAPRAWLRYDVVSRIIDRLSPATALEIGCGQGAFGARLATRADYLGVEPDAGSFEVAYERITCLGGTVLNAMSSELDPGTTYDMVCAFEVLEHIDDDKAALAEWVTHVRPGGQLVLSVPAFQERFGPMDKHAGHFRRYSPAELTARLEEAGLGDVDITVYGWPLGYALEAVRNRIDAKKLEKVGDLTPEELTRATGRTFQPSGRVKGAAIAVATSPFMALQRLRTDTGTGLVAVATRRG